MFGTSQNLAELSHVCQATRNNV